MTVMSSSRTHAATTSASSRRPYHSDSRAMLEITRRKRCLLLREEFPELCAVFGALFDDALPAGLVRFRAVGLSIGTVELDGLNAGVGLPLRVLGVLGGEFRPYFCYSEIGRLAQHGFLRVVQFIPRRLVDEDRDLGGVEAGVDAILRFLVPAEIEDARDRPAITVDHATLQRGVDFTGRCLHDGGA